MVSGTADVDVWANEPQWAGLVGEPATATYLHRGCIPLNEALGPDADAEDQAALLAEQSVTTLDDLPGFALAYGDHTATVRVEPGRTDLFERLRLGEDWPVEGFPDDLPLRRRRPVVGPDRLHPARPAGRGRAGPARRAAVRGLPRGRAVRGADRLCSAAGQRRQRVVLGRRRAR